MAHICSTITGNTPVACIEVVSAEPVETSFWIFSVASAKTALPEAPPTESSASTSGTPAANIVDERARPARDRRLVDQVAEDRHAQQQPVHVLLHLLRALPRLHEEVDAAAAQKPKIRYQ